MSLTFLPEDTRWLCNACDVPLEQGKVEFAYLGNVFQAELLRCPLCGAVLVHESLAQGRILEVEQLLEDK